MITKTFICEEHEEYGSLGWRPVDMPNADPLTGQAIPHDILEHSINDNGGIEDELKALGAAYYIRGEGGWWAGNSYGINNPITHIASDFMDLYRHFAEGMPIVDCKPISADEWAIEIAELGVTETDEEFSYEEDEKVIREDSMVEFMSRKDEMAKWLQLGYNLAYDRHKPRFAEELCYCFKEIQKKASFFEMIEGSRMIITVDDDLYVTVEEYYSVEK